MEKEKITEQEEELLNIKEFQESGENTDILDDDEIEDVIYKSNYDGYEQKRFVFVFITWFVNNHCACARTSTME